MTTLRFALEELNSSEQVLGDRFDETMTMLEENVGFQKANKDYANAIDAAVALESIEKVIVAGKTYTKDDPELRIGGVFTLIRKMMDSFNMDFGLVSVEEFNEYSQEKQYSYVTESISEFLARIWKAITDFLSKIWNWIKSLFGMGEKKTSGKDKALLEIKERGAKQSRIIDEYFKKRRDSFDVNKEMDRVLAKPSYKFSTKAIATKDGKKIVDLFKTFQDKEKFDKAMADPDVVFTLGKEDHSTIAESVVMVLDKIKDLKPHYQAIDSIYLLSAEDIKHGSGTLSDMTDAVKYSAEVIDGFSKGLDGKFYAAVKRAADIISASGFDIDKASKVIEDLYPDAREFNNFLKGRGTVIGDQVVLADFPGTEGMSFHCLKDTKALVEAFIANGAIAEHIAGAGFYRGSRSEFSGEPPMVELCLDSSCVSNTMDAGLKVFKAFDTLLTSMHHYDGLVKGLQNAADKAANSKTSVGGRHAANFAKIVLHAMNVYINQPAAVFNFMAPKIIDAVENHGRNSLLCFDPYTAIKGL